VGVEALLREVQQVVNNGASSTALGPVGSHAATTASAGGTGDQSWGDLSQPVHVTASTIAPPAATADDVWYPRHEPASGRCLTFRNCVLLSHSSCPRDMFHVGKQIKLRVWRCLSHASGVQDTWLDRTVSLRVIMLRLRPLLTDARPVHHRLQHLGTLTPARSLRHRGP